MGLTTTRTSRLQSGRSRFRSGPVNKMVLRNERTGFALQTATPRSDIFAWVGCSRKMAVWSQVRDVKIESAMVMFVLIQTELFLTVT